MKKDKELQVAANELLIKIRHDLYFVSDNLRGVLNKSSAIEGNIVLDLIEKTAKLTADVVAYHNAYVSDHKLNE